VICVTGAGGTVGSALLMGLRRLATPIRAAFFSPEKAAAARSAGMDAVTLDYHHPETLRAAFEGCHRLFLLGPNVVEQETLELNAIAAASASGIRHVVKLSVMGAEHGAYLLARIHRAVEEKLTASDMTWTFLRPNSFMQNVQTFMLPSILAESAFYTASGSARVAHVDVRDIAAVAVEALTDPAHARKAYTLTGPEALTYDEVARELSKAAGRAVRHVDLQPAELEGAMLGTGMDPEMTARLVDLERYFREGGASLVTGDIRGVTGRKPRTFREYAREIGPLLGAADPT